MPTVSSKTLLQEEEELQEIARDRSPEELYYTTLFHMFHDSLEEIEEEKIIKTRTGIRDTSIWEMLYNSFVHRLLALESAVYTGSFSLDSGMDREVRISLLGECRQIEEHIKSLRNAIKNEDHFNRQVEMNARIKELEGLLEELMARL